MNKLAKRWRSWCRDGVHFPFALDPRTNKPSITLMFPYITFVIMIISLISLHFKPTLLIATTMSIVIWAMATVFYMIRKLNSAKINLEEKSFELEGEEDDEDN